jgi:hypothetical protein
MNKTGGELMEEGMTQSTNSAESSNPGWNDEALDYVRNYPHNEFMAEDVRNHAERQGFPIPPSKRAWGGIMAKAKLLGYIKRIGYRLVNNPNAHKTPAAYWQKVS